MKKRVISVLLVVGLLVAACGDDEPTNDDDNAGMANPASVFCGEQGGTLDIRAEEAGEVGYCLFEDGSECEEWAFFRGECAPAGTLPAMPNPASVHCEEPVSYTHLRAHET